MSAINTTAKDDTERGATIFTDLAARFQLPKASGAISKHRLVSVSSNEAVQAAFNATDVVGSAPRAYADNEAPVQVQYGRAFVIADQAITSGDALKAASGGRVTQLVTPSLAGTTIEDNVGLAFTNQPANDGVEILSSSASDVQVATVYGTTQGTDAVVAEAITLTGTVAVSTVKTDWGVILAVKVASAAVGTITFREASGNATITTIAPAALSSGLITVTAGQEKAYNTTPTAVASAASTKQIGILGTSETDAVLLDSQALTGTTPAAMNDTFKTITHLLVGDVEASVTVTVKVGAADSPALYVGRALSAGAAKESRVQAFLAPSGVATDATTSSAAFGPAGLVVASKGVVVDSNKDIGDFRNVDVTNLDAGLSGTAGSVDIFPATAAKGKIAIAAADSAGDTTTTLTNASQAGARTYTVPDAGASASFVMTEGAQTINGVKTFGAASSTLNGAAAAAGSQVNLVVRKTGIADNTATGVITVTVPNANHNAAIFLDILAHLGTGTDASESSRCATGVVVLARTAGVATVAVASTIAQTQIATVAGGGTFTLAYSVSAISGAAGATQTFNIEVTIVVTGTITDHTAVVSARLLNSLGTGVTISAT